VQRIEQSTGRDCELAQLAQFVGWCCCPVWLVLVAPVPASLDGRRPFLQLVDVTAEKFREQSGLCDVSGVG
jgi:hypothetical protein